MTVEVTLPSLPRGNIQDPATGQLNQAWRQFFHDLWLRTGGSVDAVAGSSSKLDTVNEANDGEVLFVDGDITGTDNNFYWDKTGNQLFIGGKTYATAKVIIDANGDIVLNDNFTGITFGADQGADISYDGTNLNIDPNLLSSGFLRILGKAKVDEELEITGDLNHDGTNIGFHGATPVPQESGFVPFQNLADLRTLDVNTATTQDLGNVLGTLISILTQRGDLAT